MAKVYFRFLNEDNFNDDGNLYYESDFDFIIDHKLWSDYFLQTPIVEISDRYNRIDDDDYVLCILYGDPDTDDFTDVQFGSTETAKRSETDKDNFRRTLGEELGLELNTKIPRGEKYGFGKLTLTTYSINIRNTALKSEIGNVLTTKALGDDDKTRKAGVCVYGTKTDICSYLNKPDIILDESDDKITGILAVKFKDAKRYFYNNDTSRNKGWSYKEKRKRRMYFR